MKKYDNRHMQVMTDSSKLMSNLGELFYVDSNEKAILREKLKQILAGVRYQHAIDVGAGPGLVAGVLEQHADNLTLLEILPGYYAELKEKFPSAHIEIQSVLDFDFKPQYDLILFSHVLYYLAVNEWEAILQKLYLNLRRGGKLIVTHAPCHSIHHILNPKLASYSQIAYLDQQAIDQILSRIGPYQKDFYLSMSYHNAKLDHLFAKKFIESFLGLKEEIKLENYHKEFDELLALFELKDNKIGLEYHSDVFVFQK